MKFHNLVLYFLWVPDLVCVWLSSGDALTYLSFVSLLNVINPWAVLLLAIVSMRLLPIVEYNNEEVSNPIGTRV